jgi:ABC-type sulfate transport system permease subunit
MITMACLLQQVLQSPSRQSAVARAWAWVQSDGGRRGVATMPDTATRLAVQCSRVTSVVEELLVHARLVNFKCAMSAVHQHVHRIPYSGLLLGCSLTMTIALQSYGLNIVVTMTAAWVLCIP